MSLIPLGIKQIDLLTSEDQVNRSVKKKFITMKIPKHEFNVLHINFPGIYFREKQ